MPRSKNGSDRVVKSFGAELALWMWLGIVGLLGVGDPLRILLGLSTILGAFGSG